MATQKPLSSNFAHLQACDEQLVRLGMLAERYLEDDPNTSLIKMRQFGELLAKHVATQMGLYDAEKEESQYELLRRLRDERVLTQELYLLFGEIRRTGNAASHDNVGDQATTLNILKMGWRLGIWFQRSFLKEDFQAGAFAQPSLLVEEKTLETEREQLAKQADKADAKVDELLNQQQAKSERKQTKTFDKYREAAWTASQTVYLDEAQTRQIIDAQLREAGWEADTVNLRYNRGARPECGRNLAIAEYPSASGPADYLLFIGLTPIAVVKAKRKNMDVSAALQQAKCYSRGFALNDEMQSPGGAEDRVSNVKSGRNSESTVTDKLAKANAEIQDRYESLKAFAEALGDDVQVKTLKNYFASIEIHPQNRTIIAFVKADFDQVRLEEGFTRDVRKIGHFGTGDLEITIRSDEDLERAKPLIVKSYEDN